MSAVAALGQRSNDLAELYPEGLSKIPAEAQKKALKYIDSWMSTFATLGVSGLKDHDRLKQTYEKELLPLIQPLQNGTPVEKAAFNAGTKIYDALNHLGSMLASRDASVDGPVDLGLEKLIRFHPGTETNLPGLSAGVRELFQDYFQLVAPEKFAQKIEKAQESDLLVLTQKLKTYKVENLPATQALAQIWIQATGKSPQMISPDWYSPKNDPEPPITLDLKDAPAMEIIRHISEISQSHWHLRGHNGDALLLRLEQLTISDDTTGWAYLSMAEISAEGAKRLGLKPGMPSADILKRLRYFGVDFDDTRHPAAVYNAKEGKIVAVLPPGRSSGFYLWALAKLADRGQIIPYKP